MLSEVKLTFKCSGILEGQKLVVVGFQYFVPFPSSSPSPFSCHLQCLYIYDVKPLHNYTERDIQVQ